MLLLRYDEELAAKVRAAGCGCGGRIDVAHCARKPRGVPDKLGDEHARRHVHELDEDDCQGAARVTPRGLRRRERGELLPNGPDERKLIFAVIVDRSLV